MKESLKKWLKAALLIIAFVTLFGLCLGVYFTYGTTIKNGMTAILTSNAMIIVCELFVFTVIMVPIIVGIMWRLAPYDKFFTKLETGDIKFVVAGESWVKTLINIPKKTIGKDGKIRNLKDGETDQTWFQKTFGLYWVGIYPFRQIHSFTLIKERENRRIGPDTQPENWIEREDPIDVTELRWKFPRPILVPDVEFGGALRANILVLCKFEVVEPIVPIFIQKAKFFDLTSSYVRNGVINYCQNMEYQKFITANKKDDGDMSKEIIDSIKTVIESEIGVLVTGLSVSQYESSDKETQKLMEAMQKAELEGKAEVAKSKLAGDAAFAKADGEARADVVRASAKIQDIIMTVNELVTRGVDPNIAAQMAATVGRAERFTRDSSKLTTLVDGSSGTNIAIPTNQKGEQK